MRCKSGISILALGCKFSANLTFHPVLYRAFTDHRPLEMKQPDSPFFLAINHRRQPSSQSNVVSFKSFYHRLVPRVRNVCSLWRPIKQTKLSTTMSCSKTYPTPAALQSKACFREQQFKRSKAVISTFPSTRARLRSKEQIVPKKDVLPWAMTVNRTKYYLSCFIINFPWTFIFI